MEDLAEDRVYDAKAGKQVVYAATGIGVVTVEASRERVGRFGLDHRCEARDLASGGDPENGDVPADGDRLLAVATDEDVLVFDGEEYTETGFGPAVAVGFDENDLLAAGPDGELGRVGHAVEAFGSGGAGEAEWLAVADVDGAVRAIDGPLVATSDGVYRFTADGIFDVGLADVRDVVGTETPRAATSDGLYRLGNGWMDELEGGFEVVTAGENGRAHAATDEMLYELDPASGPDWTRREIPVAPVVDVTYGEGVYALAADGTFLIDRGDGWARRNLGVPDAAALAVWRLELEQ